MRSIAWLGLFTLPLAAQELAVPVGQSRTVQRAGIQSALVADESVAEATAAGDAVRITGRSAGRTRLDLTDRRGRTTAIAIRVVAAHAGAKARLERALAGIEGIVVSTDARGAVIQGEIYRVDDFEKIRSALRETPGGRNRAKLHPKVVEYTARQIELELRRAGFAGVAVRATPGAIRIVGDAETPREADEIEAIARRIFPGVAMDLTRRLRVESGVYLDIKFLEVRKSDSADLGLRWPAGVFGDGQASFGPGGLSTTFNAGLQSPLMVQTLVEKGIVKVLSNPKLLCKNGVPASFLAGGEIPIRLVSERTASVSFKPYGIQLDVTARIDRSANVALDLFARISDIDASTTVEGLPGFIEHHVKTSADVRLGSTIALGGLLENRSRKNIAKFPLLGHVPVIGELFKSRSFQNNESEFLVTLTPLDPGTTRAHRRFPVMDALAKRDLEFSLLD